AGFDRFRRGSEVHARLRHDAPRVSARNRRGGTGRKLESATEKAAVGVRPLRGLALFQGGGGRRRGGRMRKKPRPVGAGKAEKGSGSQGHEPQYVRASGLSHVPSLYHEPRRRGGPGDGSASSTDPAKGAWLGG